MIVGPARQHLFDLSQHLHVIGCVTIAPQKLPSSVNSLNQPGALALGAKPGVPPPGPNPCELEPQELKRSRLLTPTPEIPDCIEARFLETRLFCMHRQAIFAETLGQSPKEGLCLGADLKAEHHIITEYHNFTPTFESVATEVVDPLVDHFVQVDVRKNGRDNRSLWDSGGAWHAERLRMDQFVDQAQEASVVDPLTKHIHQRTPGYAAEILLEVNLDDCAVKVASDVGQHPAMLMPVYFRSFLAGKCGFRDQVARV